MFKINTIFYKQQYKYNYHGREPEKYDVLEDIISGQYTSDQIKAKYVGKNSFVKTALKNVKNQNFTIQQRQAELLELNKLMDIFEKILI